jgi:hypothetical protein
MFLSSYDMDIDIERLNLQIEFKAFGQDARLKVTCRNEGAFALLGVPRLPQGKFVLTRRDADMQLLGGRHMRHVFEDSGISYLH